MTGLLNSTSCSQGRTRTKEIKATEEIAKIADEMVKYDTDGLISVWCGKFSRLLSPTGEIRRSISALSA
jgi:hypothetical protein